VQVPRNPPDWAQRQIDATGVAGSGHGLKAARAAEADALDKLRRQVRSLQLAPGMSLGEAAGQDKSIADAVERGVNRAHVINPEYPAAGGARVTMTLDLGDVWEELQSPPPR
jgi:hypothetical protein